MTIFTKTDQDVIDAYEAGYRAGATAYIENELQQIESLKKKCYEDGYKAALNLSTENKPRLWPVNEKPYHILYYAVNKETIKKNSKRYYDKNKAELLKKRKADRAVLRENKAERNKSFDKKSYNKAYREDNKKRIAALKKDYVKNNEQKCKKAWKEYYTKNKAEISRKGKARRDAKREQEKSGEGR